MSFKIAYCSHEAAARAVKAYHYSKRMPASKCVKFGLWENEIFKGVIIFSRGNALNLPKQFGVKITEICELTRVAFTSHTTPVTQCLAISIKMLRRSNPGLRLIISYADQAEGHEGKIYQAGNWIYLGEIIPTKAILLNNVKVHNRTFSGWYRSRGLKRKGLAGQYGKLVIPPKHKYAYPLDDQMREQLQPLSKPYPRAGSIESDAPVHPDGEGRCNSDPGAQITPRAHARKSK
jgi:hypothetical protein